MYKSFRRCFKIEYAFVSNKSQRPKRLGCCSSVAHLESRISRFRTRSHMRFCAFGEIATIRFIFHVASVFGFLLPLLFADAHFPPWVIIGKRGSPEEPAKLELFAADLHIECNRKCCLIYGSLLGWAQL